MPRPLTLTSETPRRWPTWGSVVGFLCCGVLAVLVFLIVSALQDAEAPPAPPVRPPPNWAADFPERVEQVTAALGQVPLPLPTPSVASQGGGRARWSLRRYELTIPKPPPVPPLAQIFVPLRAAVSGVTVGVSEGDKGATVQIGVDGLLTHIIGLRWLERRPQLAIVVDDLGANLLIARAFSGIEARLTFAITPFTPFAQETGALAELFRREVLLGTPAAARSGEGEGVPTSPSASRAAIGRWLGDSMASVPQAIGIYGRLGLSPDADPERLRWLLTEAKGRKLFLVEPGGPTDATPCAMAAAMQIGCAGDAVVLQASDDQDEIRRQLENALTMARTRGQAIAVVPPLSAAVSAIRSVMASSTATEVDLVPVSAVVTQAR
ncbi:MAG: divergent polysaccharide deacetylase family protein [Candidatus Binatia bacterium]